MRQLLKVLFPALMLLSSSFSAHADTVYVAFGDSITAAAWAWTHLQGAPLNVPPGSSRPVADVRFFERKETLSWATGRLVQSFAKRLEESPSQKAAGGMFEVFNVARTGVPSGDLARQFDVFQKDVKKLQGLKPGAQLVATILIGANDICSRAMRWGPVERAQFRLNVVRLVDRLDSIPGFGARRILISSIPKTSALGEPPISNARSFGGMTCQQTRDNVLKICPSLVTWKNPDGRKELDRVWNDMNSILASVAAERWKKAEVAFSRAFSLQTPRSDYLAHDCFHPNLQGHELISKEIWNDQPWF